MYILLNIQTWNFNLFTDISGIVSASGITRNRLKSQMKDRKCFIDGYYIEETEPHKSKRGGKQILPQGYKNNQNSDY
jgi:hypothetical protein